MNVCWGSTTAATGCCAAGRGGVTSTSFGLDIRAPNGAPYGAANAGRTNVDRAVTWIAAIERVSTPIVVRSVVAAIRDALLRAIPESRMAISLALSCDACAIETADCENPVLRPRVI